ncbi:MAG: NB-ARC domain-containing protein, partial [Holophagales bacterium]|nr:NB-ARC domain-containing protein [Holophagales bacterium]
IVFRLRRIAPQRFERLCAELLERAGHSEVERWGLAGSEGGYDILSRDSEGRLWATQCKRVPSLGPAAAVSALRDALAHETDPPPEVFHLDAPCTLSRDTHDDLAAEAAKAPIPLEIATGWDEGHLVSRLNKHEDLRDRFIGKHGEPAPFWNVPPRTRHFTGRGDVLEQLAAELADGGTMALTQAITGLGGVGKTQAAIEYCRRYGERYRDVFWTVAPDAEALGAEYARLAVELDLVGKRTDQADAAAAFLRHLSGRADWLLVLDNVESEERWERPRSAGGHVLVTSRLKRPFRLAGRGTLALDVLEDEEAVKLLLEHSGRAKLTETEVEAARDLAVELLGGLPLAIEQAGAYLAEHALRISAYRNRFRLELLEKGQASDRSSEDTVAVTWKLNFDAVAAEASTAARALEICSLLSPDEIPLELFAEGSEALGLEPLEDPEILHERLVSPLLRYSLAKYRDPGEGAGKLSVHRLVQLVVRRSLGAEQL